MTLGDFIETGKRKLSDAYDQRELQNILYLLVEERLGWKRFEVPSKNSEQLGPEVIDDLSSILNRLGKGEPVQYVLGEADFYGLKFKVNKHVLIPRPETEELVDLIIKENLSLDHLNVLDIGTGSGCIAIAIKKNLAHSKVTAIDAGANALEVVRENAIRNKTEIDFLKVDFLDECNWADLGSFDLIVSNPPYVTKEEFNDLAEKVSKFEPKAALMAESDDPFIFYRRIADFGLNYLSNLGVIYLELNSGQSNLIEQIYRAKGYTKLEVRKDFQGLDRILKVRKV